MTTKVEVAAKEYSDDVSLQAAFHEGVLWLIQQAKDLSFRDAKLVEIAALEVLTTETRDPGSPAVTHEAAANEPAPEAPAAE